MYEKLKPYLDKRGLALADDKTKITHISEGFNFLGFNLRQIYLIGVSLFLFAKEKPPFFSISGSLLRCNL